MRKKRVYSSRIIDFLEENGVYPIEECNSYAVYKVSPQFTSLLDTYFIRTVCFKNF